MKELIERLELPKKAGRGSEPDAMMLKVIADLPRDSRDSQRVLDILATIGSRLKILSRRSKKPQAWLAPSTAKMMQDTSEAANAAFDVVTALSKKLTALQVKIGR